MASVTNDTKAVFPTLHGAASTGITFTGAPSSGPVKSMNVYKYGDFYKVVLDLQPMSFVTANAAKAIGQKLCTLPQGIVLPVYGIVAATTTSSAAAGTAGEVGLGTTIGSGANATLGAVAAGAENLMGPVTLSNHTAATAYTWRKSNKSPLFTTDASEALAGVYDGMSAGAPVHLNIASTWDAAGTLSIANCKVTFAYYLLGDE